MVKVGLEAVGCSLMVSSTYVMKPVTVWNIDVARRVRDGPGEGQMGSWDREVVTQVMERASMHMRAAGVNCGFAGGLFDTPPFVSPEEVVFLMLAVEVLLDILDCWNGL